MENACKTFFLFLLTIVRSYCLMKLNLILTKYGEKKDYLHGLVEG